MKARFGELFAFTARFSRTMFRKEREECCCDNGKNKKWQYICQPADFQAAGVKYETAQRQ